MKRFITLFLAIFMLLPTFSMFGCKQVSNSEKVLRVCNCEDYIDEDLLAEFTEETGIEVIYSTYGTNENLYNELVINPNSYDLVVPSEYMIEKLAVEGRIQKIDFSKSVLSDYQDNLSPFIKNRLDGILLKEGKNQGSSLSEFMVGYMWGTMGWVYNRDHVSDSDVKNWYSPFNNPALKKKITIKDAVRDSYIVGLAMVYENELKYALENNLGNQTITQILNNVEKSAINKVGEKLNSLKPMLYGFEVDSGKNDIVLGRIDAYVAWSGDACYAIDVACGEVEDEDGEIIEDKFLRDLSYSVPEEGSNIWFDGFVMPSGSTKHEYAYQFLEFISRPENVYRNMNYTGYTSMIANGDFNSPIEVDGEVYKDLYEAVVLGWFDESDNPQAQEVDLSYFFEGANTGNYTVMVSEEGMGRLIAQYPTADIVDRCAVMSYFDNDTLMRINDMWESVKGETFPTWLIILIAVLVILLAILVVLYRNKDKIKWLKLPQRKTTRAERKGYKVVKIDRIDF